VLATIEMFDKAVSSEAVSFGKIFAAGLPGEFSVDTANTVEVGGKQVPTLKNGDTPLNLDFSAPDRFTRETGGNATIFVANGDDFVRITTSVRKENGDRAVGTVLDHASPAYAQLRERQALRRPGHPVRQADHHRLRAGARRVGKVIAVLYVGIDISADLALLKERIKSMKVGDTGYFYVLNAAPGKNYGDLLVHPTKEGSNILDNRDADGREYVRAMLESKEGLTTYPWQNPEDAKPRIRIAAYTLFKDWNWLVAGGTYEDEIVQEAASLRNRAILSGLVALAVFALILQRGHEAHRHPSAAGGPRRRRAHGPGRPDRGAGVRPARRNRPPGRRHERDRQGSVERGGPGAQRRRADRQRLQRDLLRQPRPVRAHRSSRPPPWPSPPTRCRT
jgi:methyl-accepting chemotaxis protein